MPDIDYCTNAQKQDHARPPYLQLARHSDTNQCSQSTCNTVRQKHRSVYHSNERYIARPKSRFETQRFSARPYPVELLYMERFRCEQRRKNMAYRAHMIRPYTLSRGLCRSQPDYDRLLPSYCSRLYCSHRSSATHSTPRTIFINVVFNILVNTNQQWDDTRKYPSNIPVSERKRTICQTSSLIKLA